MRPRSATLPVEILVNPNYQLGQLSSLQVAVRTLACPTPDCDGMLVHLVDHPYIDASLGRPDDPTILRVEESTSWCRAAAANAAIRCVFARGCSPNYSMRRWIKAPRPWSMPIAMNLGDGDRGRRHYRRYRYAGTLPSTRQRRMNVQAQIDSGLRRLRFLAAVDQRRDSAARGSNSMF